MDGDTTPSPSDIPLLTPAPSTPAEVQWGYVIVMPKQPENSRQRGAITYKLRSAGLNVRKCLSRDRDEAFFYITATDALLEEGADAMELSWKVSEEHGGGYMLYTTEKKAVFKPFSSLAKQRIIRFLIETPYYAAIDIKTQLQNEVFNSFFLSNYQKKLRNSTINGLQENLA